MTQPLPPDDDRRAGVSVAPEAIEAAPVQTRPEPPARTRVQETPTRPGVDVATPLPADDLTRQVRRQASTRRERVREDPAQTRPTRERVHEPPTRERVHEAPARERVYDYVRQAIMRGDIKDGFLAEEEVSAVVNVSRTPVREAFHLLAAERWLTLVPRRGALIRPVTAQELLDVYETRRVIETHAARRLCQDRRPPPERAWQLAQALEACPATDIAGHVQLDQAFHRTLVATLNNEVMTEMYDGLRSRQQRVALSAFGAKPARLRTILDEHAALLRALEAGNADQAASVLEIHLRPLDEILARLGA